MESLPAGTVTTPRGFSAAAVVAGLKESGNLDLALVHSPLDCTAAGVFTQNQVAAAPVIVGKETLQQNNSRIRGVVVNAGNANACTGKLGLDNVRQMQAVAGHALECQANQLLVLSTGIIGMQLPIEKVEDGIRRAAGELSATGGQVAARAIMTTDTTPKTLAVKVDLPGGAVIIGGMAKGSGMIHPNMATMLGVVTTDAAVAPQLLAQLLKAAADISFNRISVDGDTSTNDTLLLLANGASGVTVAGEESIALFAGGLNYICTELAKMIVVDGEGATKFVEIQVTGCRDGAEAHAIAQTIATSPLVKTAFAGSDPNWGRILAAAGRAGVKFDQHRAALWVGADDDDEKGIQLVAEGAPTRFREADAAAVFAQPRFVIRLALGMGDGAATMWTTDLTHEYVSINADYRT